MAARKSEKTVDTIADLLRQWARNTPAIGGAAVVTLDGLMVASSLSAELDEDRMGERVVEELARGTLDQVYVHGQHGHVIFVAVGREAMLTGLCNQEAELEQVLSEADRVAASLSRLV